MLQSKVEIYQDDALSILGILPDGSINAAAFDPPYKVISGGSNEGKNDRHQRPSGILKKNDGKIFTHNDIHPDVYLPEVYRVLSDQAHLYLMTNTYNLAEKDLLGSIKRAGFQVHSILPWIKNNATPNRWYMKDTEFTIFARKGKAFPINNMGTRASQRVNPHPLDLPGVWDDLGYIDFPFALDWDNVTSPKAHPTEKPVNLMKTYIENSTQEGDVILDPFMGAGSTGVAAIETGRRFIGVELDKEHFDKASVRLCARAMPKRQSVNELLGFNDGPGLDDLLGLSRDTSIDALLA